MLTLRARIFAVISLAVLVVLAISVLLLIRGKVAQAPEAAETPGAPTNIIDQSNFDQNRQIIAPAATVTPQPIVARLSPLEIEKNSVKQLAKIFVERFNTYSSDNNGQNIREVQNIVTSAMWKRLSGRLGAKSTGPFVGSTTDVLSLELSSWDPPSATVTLRTRQALEEKGTKTTSYKTIAVKLTKVNSAWLVTSYEWQP